jgi:hypothetical protein
MPSELSVHPYIPVYYTSSPPSVTTRPSLCGSRPRKHPCEGCRNGGGEGGEEEEGEEEEEEEEEEGEGVCRCLE